MATTTTYYTAEVQDPVTGETATLTAATEAELDLLVDAHLAGTYHPDDLEPASDRAIMDQDPHQHPRGA